MQGKGKAVDISRINGLRMSVHYKQDSKVTVITNAIQINFESYPGRRENMKNILLLLFLFLNISCAKQLETKNIDIPFVDILAVGDKHDLNTISTNFEKNLWIKIYSLPSDKQNNCFPESHGVCQLNYYITSSQLDDSPLNKLYKLNLLGEIIDYKWEYTELIDTVIIIIKVNKYTKEALIYNKALQNEIKTYKLTINATSMKFS